MVAADGIHSATRAAYAATFRPELDERHARYMWLATDKVFDAFTFLVERFDFGVLQVHAYPYSAERSTFIVEIAEDAWRRGGFEALADREFARGESDEESVRRCAELLAPHLEGHRLIPNASRWIRFTTVRNATWRHRNVVLLGDAAHSAHFSIGSGTKLALEDARPGRESGRTAHGGEGVGGVRGGAAAGGGVHPAGGAGQSGVVRDDRPADRAGRRPVRVQPAHPQPPGHLREPPGPRPRVRRGGGDGVRGRRRSGRGGGGAAHVPPVEAGRPGAAQPGGGAAAGHFHLPEALPSAFDRAN